MKIIQVMPEFALAGAEVMCENLCYELTKMGHKVIAISMYTLHTPITDRLEESGIDVIYLDKKPGFDISLFGKMRKIFKKEKPDVVHTHRYTTIYAMPSAILSGIKKKVHTVHSVAQKESTNLGRKINYILFNFFKVVPVALSEIVKDTIITEYKQKPSDVPVVLNGMPLDKYTPKKDYSSKDSMQIIHIGRFSKPKNHTRLIEAFEKVCKKFPDTHLNLFGEGELLEETKKLVNEKKLTKNVDFCGLSNAIAEELAKNDIFCLPSDYEGVPMTLIEAMASAMPIVATNVGGIPDMLLTGKDAFLCEKSSDAVADCLIELISSSDLRKKFGENALIRSNEFSSQTMTKHYLEIYQKM